ncbi:vesicle coat component [Pseudocyphellaria aurata]|nr:vesicle coat component [Pseudocyphellaria aurata]
MEIESPSQGQAYGLGFWHPAMRPDSHQSIDPPITNQYHQPNTPDPQSVESDPDLEHEPQQLDPHTSDGGNGKSDAPYNDQAEQRSQIPLRSVRAESSTEIERECHKLGDDDESAHAEEHFQGLNNESTGGEDRPNFKLQPPNRKTTNQVLGSLDNTKKTVMLDDLEDRPSQAGRTHGLGVVSGGGDKSHYFAEEQVGETLPPPVVSSVNEISQEAELAAMWQAALDDDELLEDEISLNPSFFEDDGEGFLEGIRDQTVEELFTNEPFSRTREPTLAKDGNLQGFRHSGSELESRGSVSQITCMLDSSQSQRNPSSEIVPKGHITGAPNTVPTSIPHHFSAPGAYGGPSGQQYSSIVPQNSRPRMPESAQSFSDKSKGGYTSPYDLPMDVTRPKKRTHLQQMQTTSDVRPSALPPPPPRSSSMYSAGIPQAGVSYPPTSNVSRESISPPAIDSRNRSTIASLQAPGSKPSVGGFFEDLPSSKPRPSSGRGKPTGYTTEQHFQREPPRHTSVSQRPTSSSSGSSQGYQFLPPERISLYAHNSQQDSTVQPPVVNSRYSPAPVPQTNVSSGRNRYASSPSGGPRPPPPSQSLSFQPRTSSPLAQSNTLSQQYQRNPEKITPPSIDSRQAPVSRSPTNSLHSPETSGNYHSQHIDLPVNGSFSPRISQERQHRTTDDTSFEPPQRSQTQSPSATRPKQHLPAHVLEPYQRPASTNHHAVPSYLEPPNAIVPRQEATHGRSLSQGIRYITPSDGRENDPLERWRGCPVFRFGFGGTIMSSFPKQIPRYSAGQTTPLIKCSPGEVKINHCKSFVPLEESISSFPGPLKSKSKKKELLEWLQRQTIRLQHTQVSVANGSTLRDSLKRHDEKCLLWKTLQILVEHDGMIEGNLAAISALRTILSPEVSHGDMDSGPSYNSNQELVGISSYEGSRKAPDPVDPEAMEALRILLVRGEREKAVWHAVDQRLWAQAILLASTQNPNIWKQVVQEFVRQEVKTFGRNTESLASLYQIFAGNFEESIDELVPPSARAGLQMVSMVGGAGPTKNALDGLDRWRETLTLIVSNRSLDDWRALVALGRLLSSYGRTEAAHICFICAKSPGLFGGADDPQVSIALLGADHIQNPFDYNRDFDSILLTEIYDFASTVLAPSAVTTFSPYLQSYKLYHAMILAEYGYRSEAQQYCDSITAVLKSTTKLSPYFHGLLFGQLEDLIERLRQAPTDTSVSWISRDSMDRVSGSVWTRLNQFIAGEESDTGSTASGKGLEHDVSGPFARVVGDSPDISRRESSSDLYGGYSNGNLAAGPAVAVNPSNSRYAPAGQYTPRSSLEQARTESSQGPRRESQGDGLRPLKQHQQYQSTNSFSTAIMQDPPHSSYKLLPEQTGYPLQTSGYLPTPPSRPEYIPSVPPEDIPPSPLDDDSYRPIPPPKDQNSQGHHPLANESQLSSGYEPPSSNHNHSTSYEPPATNMYEPPIYDTYDPPSYNPNVPDGEGSPTLENHKKKSLMDDDDDEDFVSRAVAIQKSDKAKKDREAEEAFRRAAEEDAQKAPPLNAKKSWFGGWLGGKKDGDALNQAPSQGPIRAKLGEESSFYYDEKLKKWVNKKGNAPPTTETFKPPPPKGPPSRAVSSAAGVSSSVATPPVPPLPNAFTPPLNPEELNTPPINISQPTFSSTPPSPTRSVSSAAALAGAIPAEQPAPLALMAQTSSLGGGSPLVGGSPAVGGSPSGPPSAPPSRPATGMSNASSIDDLLGGPQARKGGTVRKGKKGRGYVDVMAK